MVQAQSLLDVAIFDLVGTPSPALHGVIEGTIAPRVRMVHPCGIAWVACAFDPADLLHSGPFVAAEFFAKSTGWTLQNIVIRPNFARTVTLFAFADVCEFLLLFVKSTDHRFNKDLVRETHIWQHAEWGKREKNYSPLGKDPGNVWLPTIDDGHGTVIGHQPMSWEEALGRCILLGVPNREELLTGAEKSEIEQIDARSLRTVILTRRHTDLPQIIKYVEIKVKEKQQRIVSLQATLDQWVARNAIITWLREQVDLPFNQFACVIERGEKEILCRQASSGQIVATVASTPAIDEIWGRLATSNVPQIRLAKGFRLETSQHQLAKACKSIEGAWVPREWDVQVQPL